MIARRAKLPTLLAAAALALATYNHARARKALVQGSVGRTIRISGVNLRVIDKGSGLPLLLLHGNGSVAEDFAISGILDQASAKHRVLAFDRPGFGGSARPRGVLWSARRQADLFHEAALSLGIRRYLVLGHSWGAWIALEMARRHGRSVAGLVLVSGYYYPPPRLDLAIAALPALPLIGTALRHTLLPLGVRLGWQSAMRTIFQPGPISDVFSAATREIASRPSQLRSVCEETGLMLGAALLRKPSYRDIDVPTGIVAGAGDRLFDARHEAERLHAEISGSLIEIVPHSGHMAHHSDPRTVLRMLDRVANLQASSLQEGDRRDKFSPAAL
ncbi:alpha/beta fold hydrolase [Mesorhizobium sp. ES1-1]|uniref:alpha/beta fold hydrolase n=1 Tax=Mesorhizobium sp. ES1-1 TaxID=2876629 RepID=UPI001CCFA2E2|nr:alpha/beta hydrolase [Mesorhizobium sp. ES1-1]MBZ9677606.1 alpha/beta hydrolase [Mesorhizobium sp. ES1-1]